MPYNSAAETLQQTFFNRTQI